MTTTTEALATVREILSDCAALLGQPEYFYAEIRRGKIVLVADRPLVHRGRLIKAGDTAKVLGGPDEAIAAANRAWLRAGTKVHGHPGE